MKLQNHSITNSVSLILLALLPASNEAFAFPTISENTITIEEGHWIEVQNPITYASVCQGATSCGVGPGTYTVIDHTSGERFEQITIESETVQLPITEVDIPANNSEPSEDTTLEVTLNGNTISWPNDGWYQVQNKADFSTVCEGGRQCHVTDGTYIVINHTTGTRNELVVGSAITLENGIELLNQAFEVFHLDAYDRRVFEVLNADDFTVVSSAEVGFYDRIETHYSCPNGGTAVRNFGSYDRVVINEWDFENCLSGNEINNGYARSTVYTNGSNLFSYDNFTRRFGAEGEMQISGALGVTQANPDASQSWQNSFRANQEPISYSFTYSGGTLTISDALTFFRSLKHSEYYPVGAQQLLEGSFRMEPPFMAGEFEVTANLQGSIEISETFPIQIQTGSMQIVSTIDGSFVALDPNTGDIHTVRIKTGNISSSSATIEMVQRWSDLPFYSLLLNRPFGAN